jgi:hypothetical protein
MNAKYTLLTPRQEAFEDVQADVARITKLASEQEKNALDRNLARLVSTQGLIHEALRALEADAQVYWETFFKDVAA